MVGADTARRNQDVEHRALGMDREREGGVVRGRRRRGERGDGDENPRAADVLHHQPYIFMPSGIFFMSILPPASPAAAGPCAPTPCTSSESFTLPAFSNSRVTGTLSPCLSGFFRSNSIK